MPPSIPVARCRRCTLPVDPAVTRGHLAAGPDGECPFCHAYDRRWPGGRTPPGALERLDAIAARARGRDYDALVPISGGKDSLAVLDLVRERWPRLRILAATLDNGFLAPAALANCRVLAKALGVDHVLWAPPGMRELARRLLVRTGHFCGGCQVALMQMYHSLSARHGIPLVFLGTSRRLDGAHPESANPWTPPFIDAVLDGEPDGTILRRDACEPHLLYRFGLRTALGLTRTVLVPDHVEWDPEANARRLVARYPGVEIQAEHADCLAAPVADWLYKRRCGFGQKSAGLAARVRAGRMSRDDALRALDTLDEFGESFPSEGAGPFLGATGLSETDVRAASQRTPDRYFSLVFRAVGTTRRTLGLSIA